MMEALTVFSSCIKIDPSLKSGDPMEKFEHLRRPESLKASPYQVANAMSQTFQTAHDSVTTIVNSLENMPTLMTDCLEAMEIVSTELFKIDQPGSQDVIDYALETLTYSADDCVNAALEVDNDCTKALLIINENSFY
uniref:Pectinesterase inhibitor domain-containing protein n=1 Tax=Panagrolaimus sp. ES5 TaxID=591445 RepID=A0AC34F4V2_9BILA